MNNYMQIAKTIYSQIKAGNTDENTSGLTCMMCWGLTKAACINEVEHDNHFGGLQFKVTGALFRGQVRVMLNANDTYTIFTTSPRGKVWSKLTDTIYADQLTAVLDNHIERKIL